VACTIKTNSSGAPAHTLVLIADKPYHWNTNSYYANTFITTDITSFYCVVAGATAGVIQIEGLVDGTP
jgi:hypothetical protein